MADIKLNQHSTSQLWKML